MKKVRSLPKKTIQIQNSSGIQLLNSYSNDRAQFSCFQIDNIHITVNKTDITGPIVRTISTE